MKNKIMKTLTILSCLTAFNAFAISNENIKHVTNNTTLIKTDKGAGTGFFIEDTKLMVTNKHVANHLSKLIRIKDSSGKEYFGQFVFSSLDYDLALIKVFDSNDTIENNKTDLRFNGGIKLCENSKSEINDEVFGIGSPAGKGHMFRKGYINSVNKYNTQFKHKVISYQEYTGSGTSGSAIIHDKRNCLIGVNFAGLLNFDMGIAIPVELFKDFLNEYNEYSTKNRNEKIIFLLNRVNKKDQEELDIIIDTYIKDIKKRKSQIELRNNKIKQLEKNDVK